MSDEHPFPCPAGHACEYWYDGDHDRPAPCPHRRVASVVACNGGSSRGPTWSSDISRPVGTRELIQRRLERNHD